MLLVPQIASGNGRMMADLLANKSSLSHLIMPLRQEEFTQERIQRFLDSILFVSAGVLLSFESREEPSQHKQSSLFGVGFVGRCYEDRGVFGPVGWKFDGRLVA